MIPSDPETSGPVHGSGVFLADMGYPDPDGARARILLENDLAVAVEDGRLTPDKADRILATLVGAAELDRGEYEDMDDVLTDLERIIEAAEKAREP